MTDRGDELTHYHNLGQEDGVKGEYNAPHGVVWDTFFTTSDGFKHNQEENEAYHEGFEHSYGQTHDSGLCFLTAACVQVAGLPDDCHELTTLRRFRDTFISGLHDGETMIRKYYDLAPRIVEKLSAEELKSIYATVQLAVAQIGRGELNEALLTYSTMFRQLSAKHLGVRI